MGIGLRQQILLQALHGNIERQASDYQALDLGCGSGRYRPLFPNAIGLDWNDGDKVHVLGNAQHLPFADESFDRILCTEVLEHTRAPWEVTGEMYRVLKPGGRAVVTMPYMFPVHDQFDFIRYTMRGYHELFTDKGFGIVEYLPLATDFDLIAVLLQRLALQYDFRGPDKLIKLSLHALAKMIRGWPNRLIAKRYLLRDEPSTDGSIMNAGHFIVVEKPGGATPSNAPLILNEILRCPACGGQVDASDNAWSCRRCGARYASIGGKPKMR